ncbi:MAG: S46 family peptidase [Rhodothermales bacterium]
MTRLAPLALAFLLFVAGCVSTGETAIVTERPVMVVPDSAAVASAQMASTSSPNAPSSMATPYDTVQARRFDSGKMWTFDNPPLDYFAEAYSFSPDTTWFNRARLGALRFADYCSASFVSPGGLVMTNHHCGRESVTDVSRPGENLLDNGFYAAALEDERKVEDLYVDQLISIEDVTDRVYSAAEKARGREDQARARERQVERIQERMQTAAQARDSSLQVQVIELYNGGQYSAYTFHRYKDVRLVMAPELDLGFFGGDADNFTYPRYALDMSFFRVYNDEGEPLQTANYFPWSEEGAEEGEVVFVVGNPGSTSRLATVSQLAFERDFGLPQQLDVLQKRAEILTSYIEANPDSAGAYDLRNRLFSINNSIKNFQGQLEGLEKGYLTARRSAAERQLQEQIMATDTLRESYGDILGEIEELQLAKEAVVDQAGAFTQLGNPDAGSALLTRALYGYVISLMKQRGGDPEQIEEYREEALKIGDVPDEVEEALVAARIRQMQQYLGERDLTVRRLLDGGSPEAFAKDLVARSALVDSSGFAPLLEKGYLGSKDASVPVIEAIAPIFFTFSQQFSELGDQEGDLEAALARARFAVEGTSFPPDASFSLRIADGIVKGYNYNGTQAPPHTTIFGLYADYYAYGPDSEWNLPERWLEAPETLDRSTAFNLVSTNDITGGNSGSPLLNQDLEVVGLIFDSNIEALPNEFLYTDDVARAISVDARGMLEVLDEVYDADRIVLELTTGERYATEEEADAAAGG